MAHKWDQQYRFVLLQEYAKHKKEFLCKSVKQNKIWKEIAEEVRIKCYLDCTALECCNEIKRSRLRYERNKNRTVTKPNTALFQYHAKCAFEMEGNSGEGDTWEKQAIKEEKIDSPSEVCSDTTAVSVSSVPTTESAAAVDAVKTSSDRALHPVTWKRDKIMKLLDAYKKYKTELTCPGVEKERVWKKIAVEVQGNSTKFRCDGLDCCNMIEELKLEYKKTESHGIMDRNMAYWFDKLILAFETNDDQGEGDTREKQAIKEEKIDSPSEVCSVTTAVSVSSVPTTESAAGEGDTSEKQAIKEEKIDSLSEACSVTTAVSVSSVPTIESAAVKSSAQQPPTRKIRVCGRKNKFYRRKLLLVYAKYKTEFLDPVNEEKRVWEKIAKEMREDFFFDCGGFLCRFDILMLQRQYNDFKNTHGKKYLAYLNEAQQAFETTSNPDFRQTGVGNCSEESTFPNSNNRKHEEEQNSWTSYKNFRYFQAGVGNCSDHTQSIFPYLNKRKHEEQQNPSTSCKKMATERRSWYLGGEFGCGS